MINASDILKASILIVDDQAANLSLRERILRGAGYAAITTATDSFATTAPGSARPFTFQCPQKKEPAMNPERININRKAIPDGDSVAVGIVAEVRREACQSPNAGGIL